MSDRTKGQVLEAGHTGFEGIRQQTAITAGEKAENPSSAHFSRVGKIVKTGLGVERHICIEALKHSQNKEIENKGQCLEKQE